MHLRTCAFAGAAGLKRPKSNHIDLTCNKVHALIITSRLRTIRARSLMHTARGGPKQHHLELGMHARRLMKEACNSKAVRAIDARGPNLSRKLSPHTNAPVAPRRSVLL